jgi:hypothetical protein
MRSTASVAYTAPERGLCQVCGVSFRLRAYDGFVKRHGECPGGGKAPAPTTTDINAAEGGR